MGGVWRREGFPGVILLCAASTVFMSIEAFIMQRIGHAVRKSRRVRDWCSTSRQAPISAASTPDAKPTG